MGSTRCSACYGSGSVKRSTSVPNYGPGGSTYQVVEYNESCGYCCGAGYTYSPDPVSYGTSSYGTSSNGTTGSRTKRGFTRRTYTEEEADRSFGNLVVFAVIAVTSWYMYFGDIRATTEVKVGIVVAAVLAAIVFLNRFKRLVRVMRYAFLIALAGFGVVTLASIFTR